MLRIRELRGFVTPGLALFVWFLAAYIYFAYLHHYWEKSAADQGLADKFSMFLLNDLLFEFRKPLLLLPVVVSGILLFWIAATISPFLLGPLTLAAYFGGAFLLHYRKVIISQASSNDSKRKVEAMWSDLKKKIKSRLSQQQWVDTSDFSDLGEVWGVTEDALSYALAKYAVENPNQTRFAVVYIRESKMPASHYQKVLVNLQNFRDDIYYLT